VLDFKESVGQSIGIEIEFQLLDRGTFDLVDGILPLMDLCSKNPHIVPEYEQTSVEINTRICSTIREMEQDVFSLVSIIREKCRALGMVISGAGTHPFCSRLAKITPFPRFLSIERMEGYLGHASTTFALHVHVGMTTGEETIAVMKRLRLYLPVLIALSASSPFWWGHDTGYACYRQRVLAATRSYGIPPFFDSWKDFSDFFDSAIRAEAFHSLEDIHWDIRPRPDMGTLELRVMDSQATVREAVILSSFVFVLVAHIRKMLTGGEVERVLKPLKSWIEKENYFRATRFGIDTIYIADNSGYTRPMRAVIEDTIEAIAETAHELGEGEHLRQLEKMLVNGSSYVRQRKIFKETGSLKEVSASMVRELEEDLERYRINPVNSS
jgi:carboxylate-amine ligase